MNPAYNLPVMGALRVIYRLIHPVTAFLDKIAYVLANIVSALMLDGDDYKPYMVFTRSVVIFLVFFVVVAVIYRK